MSKFLSVAALAAAALTLAGASFPTIAANAADAIKAAPMIFDGKHLNQTKEGEELVYDFSTKPSDEKLAAAAFKDTITLKITGIHDDKREVEMQIYTGTRAREVQKMGDLTINPLFIVSMQQAVSQIAKLTGGDFNYLKVRFSKVLDASVMAEPIKIDYKGQPHDAYKIAFTPFKDDPNVAKLHGYEKSTYAMIVSPTVPGQFVESVSNITSTAEGGVNFEDRTAIAGFGGVK